MALLRAILRKCVNDWQVLDSAPRVPMYRPQSAEPRWLTREQFAKLCKELPEHLQLAARFATSTRSCVKSWMREREGSRLWMRS